jgi:predicted transcriptional regulator
MTALSIRLPDAVHRKTKELAASDGVSVNQFIASATAEKMASVMTLDWLRAQASQGRREDFLALLNAAPDVPPIPGDEHKQGTVAPLAELALFVPLRSPPLKQNHAAYQYREKVLSRYNRVCAHKNA